jgi:hypothetical protein
MKTNLFKILWKKEVLHWIRIMGMFKKFKGWLNKLTFGVIVAILVTLGHWCFALMHTFYELLLFIFARDVFKANMQKMTNLKIVKQ